MFFIHSFLIFTSTFGNTGNCTEENPPLKSFASFMTTVTASITKKMETERAEMTNFCRELKISPRKALPELRELASSSPELLYNYQEDIFDAAEGFSKQMLSDSENQIYQIAEIMREVNAEFNDNAASSKFAELYAKTAATSTSGFLNSYNSGRLSTVFERDPLLVLKTIREMGSSTVAWQEVMRLASQSESEEIREQLLLATAAGEPINRDAARQALMQNHIWNLHRKFSDPTANSEELALAIGEKLDIALELKYEKTTNAASPMQFALLNYLEKLSRRSDANDLFEQNLPKLHRLLEQGIYSEKLVSILSRVGDRFTIPFLEQAYGQAKGQENATFRSLIKSPQGMYRGNSGSDIEVGAIKTIKARMQAKYGSR
jgi:hypothetical protein